jgi:cyanophycinase
LPRLSDRPSSPIARSSHYRIAAQSSPAKPETTSVLHERRRSSDGERAMSPDRSSARGHLVAIGGAEDKTSDLEILRRLFALAPQDNKDVAVLATATGFPEEVVPLYEKAFERLGASRVHHLDVRTREDAREAENVEIIRQSGTIFFTGGDQLRLTNVLGGSPVLEEIRTRFREGAVVAGTSAGAAAMSATMIYNGAAADALRKGAVKMSGGLAFVHGIVIDSHFLERGRFTRLMEVGATNPEYIGVGLGEDAGVIVHHGQILEAIGPGHVIVVDSRSLKSSNVAEISEGDPVAVEHVVMHALISGCGYDVRQRRHLQAHELATTLELRLENTGTPRAARAELL